MTIKAVFFDYMGTCLNWHSSITSAIPDAIPRETASRMAISWRRHYFQSNSQRVAQNLPPEDIGITLARTLETLLDEYADQRKHFIENVAKMHMVRAWHAQPPWPEVKSAIDRIRNDGLEVFVHGNGTTRLQLDLTAFAGLRFDMLFSSELLGVYKPNKEAYLKALRLVKLQPDEVVLVAAHAYDLRGARACGMKTVYVHRWTDDVDEDMGVVRGEVDVFLESMDDLPGVIAEMS